MFKAPFSFEGRITRTEFLATLFVSLFVAVFAGAAMNAGPGGAFFGIILILAMCGFGLAQGWKRAHDAGWTGLINLFPCVSIVVLLIAGGDEGPNKYGPNPRKLMMAARATSPSTYTPPPLPESWERARQADAPRIRTISFKCGACGAQNANVEYQGTACCQFCGAPKE